MKEERKSSREIDGGIKEKTGTKSVGEGRVVVVLSEKNNFDLGRQS